MTYRCAYCPWTDSDESEAVAHVAFVHFPEIVPERKVQQPLSRHGTRTRYVQGCHCGDCTRANRDYARRKRASRV